MTSDKTRIMLIVPMLDQGGLERVCALTAQLLKEKHDVHLVVFNTTGMIYDVSGVHLIDLALGAVPGAVGKLLNVGKRVRRVRKLKKELKIQISYSFGPTANLVNVLSKQKDITWAGVRGYGALANRLGMQFICKRVDRTVSCTRIMEKEIAQAYSVKASATLYNPCNLAEIKALKQENVKPEFEAFLKRQGATVVSMGRAHDVKGFWHLIKSIYLLRKKGSVAKLMIIGDGDYSEYKTLAKALGMDEEVLFTGVQKNPFALLARADVYALTSDSEGFPNALIEAMACGLPCVSVNCKTGPSEILHQNYQECADLEKCYDADYGLLMPIFKGEKDLSPDSFTKEEELFAEGLYRILTEQKLYDDYVQKAIWRAECFSQEEYQHNIEKLIHQDSVRD